MTAVTVSLGRKGLICDQNNHAQSLSEIMKYQQLIHSFVFSSKLLKKKRGWIHQFHKSTSLRS